MPGRLKQVAGKTYWFNGSCGSSITSSIGTGTTITVNPTTTTTYYCRNYVNGMWSANCVSSTLYVSSLPATPTNPTSNSPFCGSVTLSAAAPPVAILLPWTFAQRCFIWARLQEIFQQMIFWEISLASFVSGSNSIKINQ